MKKNIICVLAICLSLSIYTRNSYSDSTYAVQTPAANSVPKSGISGQIDPGWLATVGGGGYFYCPAGGACSFIPAVTLFSQPTIDSSFRSLSIGTTLKIGTYTVATRPLAVSGNINSYITVTDCESSSACVAGGGSTALLLRSTGSAWVIAGAGGGLTYPGAGIAVSTGSAWGTSLGIGTLADGKFCTYSSTYGFVCNSEVIGLGNNTFTGKQTTAASTTSSAGFNLPHGAAPTLPVNGDLWTSTAGLYARINGATIGPFGTATITGSGTQYYMPLWTGSGTLGALAGIGTSGQVLTSNGAGAAPTFQAAAGGALPANLTVDGSGNLANSTGGFISEQSAFTAGGWQGQELSGNGTDFFRFEVPNNISASRVFKFVATDPIAGQVMAWSAPDGGGNIIQSWLTALSTANKISDLAATSSSELAGKISDETGTGSLVFGTGPAITMAEVDGHTDATNLTAAQLSNTTIHNVGQGANAVTLNLPTLANGMSFTLDVGEAQSSRWRIKAATGQYIYLLGTDGTSVTKGSSGGYIGASSPAVGNCLACKSFKDGASSVGLQCKAVNGTWTQE